MKLNGFINFSFPLLIIYSAYGCLNYIYQSIIGGTNTLFVGIGIFLGTILLIGIGFSTIDGKNKEEIEDDWENNNQNK